jgi:ABC-type uncharacterized transport system substrate-binding protein
VRRRDLLGGAVAAAGLAPLRARALARKPPRVGVLLDGSERVIPQALREALRSLGYIDGQNIRLEFRSAQGDPHRLRGLAAALVSRKVDLIVATLTGPAVAAKEATGAIPIVMVYVGDPVGTGIVASLARPGGNITGLSSLALDATAKQLGLLMDAVPHATRLAVLHDKGPYGANFSRQLAVAGRARGVAIEPFAVATAAEIETAFAAMAARRIDGLVVQGVLSSTHVAGLALRHRLPAVSQHPAFARQGGLLGYFSDPAENARRAAVFIDKILKGAKPADLPVEQPTKFALVINLKTAKALGLTISPLLLAQADAVIE